MNKKVLILTEGGRGIGFGHVTRSIALLQGFRQKGCNPKILANTDKTTDNLFCGLNWTRLNWLEERDKLSKHLKGVDILIIDSYLAGISFYNKVSKLVNLPVYIDDNKRLNYPRGLVINPSIYGDSFDYPSKKDRNYLLGRDYVILRKQLWDTPPKTIKKKVKNVLIAFGGTNNSKLIRRLITHVKKKFNLNCYTILPGKKMVGLMQTADICISGGGQTLYELARMGVPTIGVCFAANQKRNIEAFYKKGLLEYVGFYKDKRLFDEIDKTIVQLIKQSVRRKKSSDAKHFIDGKGVRRIIDAIIKLDFENKKNDKLSLKIVAIKDCCDLWLWRNHPETRIGCLNSQKVSYKDHRMWFKKKMRDKNAKMYIVENQAREKIGQIRFEKKKNGSTIVNVNLNPCFFRQGLGSKLIAQASRFFVKNNRSIKQLNAEVISGNTISERAFKKAGYLFSHKTKRNKKTVLVLKFRK